MEKLELLVRKSALKDVELWLYAQYQEIDDALEVLDKKAALEALDKQGN